MIRRLRRRHRLAWAVLFPILAILLALALLARPEPPLVDELPEPPAMDAETAGHADNPAAADRTAGAGVSTPRPGAVEASREPEDRLARFVGRAVGSPSTSTLRTREDS